MGVNNIETNRPILTGDVGGVQGVLQDAMSLMGKVILHEIVDSKLAVGERRRLRPDEVDKLSEKFFVARY